MDFSNEFMQLHEAYDKPEKDYDTDEVDEDMKSLAKHAKGKKKKKDKKRKKKEKASKLRILMDDLAEENIVEDIDSGLPSDEDFLIHKKSKKGRKKELFDIKQAKKKKKKNIEAKFAPQLTALRKILKDTDAASADIRTILDRILNSKSRYTGKSLTDLLQALNTANSTRAGVVRDIANINKTVIDLALKQEKANPKKDKEESDDEEYGINLFRRILSNNGGRKEMLQAAQSVYNDPNNQYDDYSQYGEPEEDPNDVIADRLNSEDNKRSDEGNMYIKYENMEPEDVVMLHKDGSWYMDAVDKNGKPMPAEYPRLNEEDLGDLRLELDIKTAFDSTGRKFRIVEIQ